MKPTAVFDSECYVDYWLISFQNVDTGNVKSFELYQGRPLDIKGLQRVLAAYTLVSFNGRNYDLPMIALALTGADTATLKAASDDIILNDLKPWEFERAYDVKIPIVDHIDLIEVAPGQASLKLYGGRMHSRRLQDLPIAPHEVIGDRRETLRTYCENDLATTSELRMQLLPQLTLRATMSAEYGIDLRSKSDAQIAEAVIRKQITDRIGHIERPIVKPGTVFRYKPPKWMRFDTLDVLDLVRAAEFRVANNGSVEMPPTLASHVVTIGQGVYRMGIGGLHSSEKCTSHHADDTYVLVDRDVASYYPSIILNEHLAPEHLGDAFLEVYRVIVAQRLAAKAKVSELKRKIAEVKARIAELENEQ